MDLTTVIVNYKSLEPLLECLDSLALDGGGIASEVVVVDNASGDGAAAALAQRFPDVRFVANAENVGFARAVNQGIRAGSGEAVLVINPDCVVRPGALRALLGWLREHPRTGIAAPRVLSTDGALEFSARSYPDHTSFLFNRYSLLTRLWPANPFSRRYLLTDWDHLSPRDVDWVSGACMMVRRQAIDEVGAFDEAFFMFNEDVDWCRRMNQAGWKVSYVPDAVVVHHVGASSHRTSNKVILERHRGMIHYFHKHHPTNALVRAVADSLILARAGLMMAANALKR
jgi:N-acetylglucosaminyl-diphospho-decaprenol L-rhamnosyltransferase